MSAQAPKTGELGNATVVENNPPGVIYAATLPDAAFFKGAQGVKGSIAAVANPDGVGVLFKVRFSGLPKEGGPFTYHLHVDPVPADGNCTKTLAHLDPFIRGEDPVCNPDLPETCQVGDLSGKYGKITSDPFEDAFYDEFASTQEGIGAFFGNRSFVLHFANKTRIGCANFAKVDAASVGDFPMSTACEATQHATPSATPNVSPSVTKSATQSTITTPASNYTMPLSSGTSSTTNPTSTQTIVTVSGGNNLRLIDSVAGAVSFMAAVMFMI